MSSASLARRYGLAVATPFAALALRAALGPALDDTAPMLLFFLAVVLAAWRGGVGAGLFATALSVALADWYLIASTGSLFIPNAAEGTRLAVFALEGVAISLLSEAMPRASWTPSGETLALGPPRATVLKLTLLVAVIVAVLLAALLSAGQRYWRDVLREQIDTQLRTVAEARLQLVQSQIARDRRRIARSADHAEFRALLAGAATGQVLSAVRRRAQLVLDGLAGSDSIRDARLLDHRGRVVLASDPAQVGRDFADDPVFQDGLTEPHFGLPRHAAGRYEVILAAPVLSADETAQTLGVLWLTADITPLAQALRDAADLGRTGEVQLGVREGGRIRFLFPPRFNEAMLTAAPTDVPTMAAALDGREFFERSRDYRGAPVLAVGRSLDYGGWGLVAKLDEAEAYAPIVRASQYGLGLATFIALLGLASAYGLARHGLREPADSARPERDPDRLTRALALAVLLIGLLVLAGWALKLEVLQSLLPGVASMRPLSALCFVLAGVALALRRKRAVRLVCAVPIIVLGVLSLVQDSTGANFGSDQLLFSEMLMAQQTGQPGRMSVITAINFILLGSALLLLDARWPVLRRTMEALALLAGLAALLSLIVFVHGAETPYQLPPYRSMAPNSALAFVLFAAAILWARGDGLAAMLASPGLGGQVARRFLPLAIIAPVVLGWLVQSGEEAGLFNSSQDTALLDFLMVLVLGSFVWWNAQSLETADTERTRAETRLREREADERARRSELETLMAAIPAAVLIAHDPACEQMAGNPAAIELLRGLRGLTGSAGTAESVQGDFQAWSQGRRLAVQELPMQRAAASGQAVTGAEFDIVFPDGATRHLLGSALPLFDEAGVVRGCVGAFMDITQRERRERNLAFLAEMQKLLAPLTSAEDIMRRASERIAAHLNLQHCLLAEVDEAAEQLTILHDHHAADASSLVGVYRIADFRPETERRELAAGKTLVIDDVRGAARSAAQVKRFEALGIGALVNAPYVAEGRWKFLLSALHSEPHAWLPEDAELMTELAARLYLRIERARAEAELGVGRQRLAGIVDSALDAIITISADQRIVLFNAAAEHMFRCPAAQALGTEIDRFVPLRLRAAHHAHIQRFGESDVTSVAMDRRGGSLSGLRSDGEEFPIEASISKLEAGGERLFTVILRDITERKNAEALARMRDQELRVAAEVALASKYKSEFLANMSHELRTPLNSLLILSRLLADNAERNLSPKQVEFAEIMHQSGSDLLRLINEILDLSRIEAGQMNVYVEAVTLANLGKNIERNFRHVAQSRSLEFSVHVDPDLPAAIRTDANRLEQVLKNLLANSFKFTESGNVTLTMSRATQGWTRPHPSLDTVEGVVGFAVSDTGIGIAPQKRQLIFEAFAQADGTTSRKYGGTGLGLSISREIAGLLGGQIALTSEAGQGSTFTLYLPFAFVPKAPASKSAAELELEPSRRQVEYSHAPGAASSAVQDDREAIKSGDDVLLMVENDPIFARLLLDIAHRHAFKGLVATSAAAALQLARSHRPAAITLSVTLPDMDGWKLLQCVNDDLAIRHIPVHIVSGEDERPRGLRQGASSYLQKPVSEAALGELFDRIRAADARGHSMQLLIIEDDPATQSQILQVLGAAEAIETILVPSAEQGLALLRSKRFDCVVLDLRLPGLSGFQFLEAVRDEMCIDDLPIVVYTGMDLSLEQQSRLNQLAESVLLKDARSLDRLLDQASRYLRCPLSALPAPARATLERLHGSAAELVGAKVLVVDDDMRNVYALFAILENARIEADYAGNGRQCLEMLGANLEVRRRFDAVLMDIMMPEMDGYETMRRIREIRGMETLPVIALTAKAMKGDREKCIAAGASDYLAKPVDAQLLLAQLRFWIHR
ncbi:MAG: response regulator [Burkholderiaceae bacterium]